MDTDWVSVSINWFIDWVLLSQKPSKMAGLRQVGLLTAGAQPWNTKICAASGERFAYCATLAIYIYQVFIKIPLIPLRRLIVNPFWWTSLCCSYIIINLWFVTGEQEVEVLTQEGLIWVRVLSLFPWVEQIVKIWFVSEWNFYYQNRASYWSSLNIRNFCLTNLCKHSINFRSGEFLRKMAKEKNEWTSHSSGSEAQ